MFGYSPFGDTWRKLGGGDARGHFIQRLVHLLEKETGSRVVYDTDRIPYGDSDLLDLFLLAEKIRAAGALASFQKMPHSSDEPHFFEWRAESNRLAKTPERIVGSGSSFTSNRTAFLATLAEVTERNVWSNYTDYFSYPTPATCENMSRRGAILHPQRFTGIPHQRDGASNRVDLFAKQTYTWIRTRSLVTEKFVWLPAQTIASGCMFGKEREPLIREQNTNGLATRPTRDHATLYGALELIERDAFMIMWLNQLSLPRVAISSLFRENPNLKKLVAYCAQYRLRVHIVRMITDAPAHALCAIVEDETEFPPMFSLGLKAHWNIGLAAEGAIMEALRMRKVSRRILKNTAPSRLGREAKDVGHLDRLTYWMENNRHKKLGFLVSSPEEAVEVPWKDDTEESHLKRIVAWCRSRNYEFVSVALTRSKGNATPWHIEMAVIPELQPIHLNERNANVGGARLSEIPKMFGYPSLSTPYLEDPHPFA